MTIDDYLLMKKDDDLELRLRHQLNEDLLVVEQTGALPTFLVMDDYVEYLKVARRIESRYSFFLAESYYKHSEVDTE